MQHDHYRTKAEDNRISIVPMAPNRGLILDRNGVVLARNYSRYTLEITPQQGGNVEATINELAKLIEITPRDRAPLQAPLGDQERREPADPHPPDRRRGGELRRQPLPLPGRGDQGAPVPPVPVRRGRLARHRLHRPHHDKDDERLEAEGVDANYRGTDYIGKTGIEASYERELHGTTGSEQVEIDAAGRGIRTLASTPPISGNNLVLTLDMRLQEVAERAFGNCRGALVAIEPATGGVLALVSKPGFDPNLFVDGIDPQSWDALNNNPDQPLNNRAMAGAYPPGSTFKPFMALVALELGKRTPEYTITDPGYFVLPGVRTLARLEARRPRRGRPAQVDRDLLRHLLLRARERHGHRRDARLHEAVRVRAPTGIDIQGERGGLLPSPEWKRKRFKSPQQQKWYPGDTISVGIGQGYNLATPIQLALATATLAANGAVYRPHLVRHVDDARTGETRAIEPQPVRTVEAEPK